MHQDFQLLYNAHCSIRNGKSTLEVYKTHVETASIFLIKHYSIDMSMSALTNEQSTSKLPINLPMGPVSVSLL